MAESVFAKVIYELKLLKDDVAKLAEVASELSKMTAPTSKVAMSQQEAMKSLKLWRQFFQAST